MPALDMTGIRPRHQRACPNSASKEPTCKHCALSYRAEVYDPQSRKKLRSPWMRDPREAIRWRRRTLVAIERGELSTGESPTLRQAGDELLAGMRSGTIRNVSGGRFAPSTIVTYEQALRLYLYPGLDGDRRLSAITRDHVQDLVDQIAVDRASQTAKNAMIPLGVIYRRWNRRRGGGVRQNPTRDIDWPARDEREIAFAEIDHGLALIDALAPRDRAAWALLLLGGLRLGEMCALTWEDVTLEASGQIKVSKTYCLKTKQVLPRTKTRRSRTITMPAYLLRILREHRLLTGRRTDLVVWNEQTGGVESRDKLVRRARKAWKAAGLDPITPQGGRHSFASLAVEAQVDTKGLQAAIGHTRITTTMDRYAHLYRGAADTTADRIDARIARAVEAEA